MKLTLRAKVLAALLLCSLSAVTVVALVTPWLLEHRFIAAARRVHFPHFTQLVERYQQLPGALPWGTRGAAADLYRRIVLVDKARRVRPDPGFVSPPGGALPGLQGRARFPSPPGFPLGPGGRRDPFASQNIRFVLADTGGYVFLPFYGYHVGQRLSWLERLRADRFYLHGKPVGYALVTGTVPQTGMDKSYRTMLYQSLALAGGLAMLFSILAAVLLTRPILRQLHYLSEAVSRMKSGNRAQTVRVRGHDEIASLARAFNRMSDELTVQYESLQMSNATIAEQARSLQKMSYTDELTGLHNRRYFNEQFDRWFSRCRRERCELALIVIDIDYFKKINDGFSHQIGDEVLQQIARLLRECVRSQDILARFGGEEFILLMPFTDVGEAADISQRMRRQIEQHRWHQIAVGLQVTASFGVAGRQASRQEMLKLADEQLYRAKDAGRNCVCVA